MRVVGDCEADDLFGYGTDQKPSKIHCAVFRDLDTLKWFIFAPLDQLKNVSACSEYVGCSVEPLHTLPDFLDKCKEIWLHNGIGYDRKLIEHVFGYKIPLTKLKDSLLLSRAANHVAFHKFHPKLRNKHSVEAWAEWLGLDQKKVVHEDWSQFSMEMLHRCYTDVVIQEAIVKTLIQELKDVPEKAIQEEILFGQLLEEMRQDGFYLYKHRAEKALNHYKQEVAELTDKIRAAFPAEKKLDKKFVARFRAPKTKEEKQWAHDDPRLLHKKDREWLEQRGLPLTTKEFEYYVDNEFNIASPKQRVERLLAMGWQPEVFTKKGQPSSPKANCPSLENSNLPEEAKLIGLWLLKQSRVATIESWLDACADDGHVHGFIKNVGAWTMRCAHSDPQMGNIPGRPKFGVSKYDVRLMRSCWGVKPEDPLKLHDDMPVLVGCDASGIQGRALANYIYEATGEREYLDLVADPSVDLHVYNQKAAGLPTRDAAKTFYYSYVLGVGYRKIALQVGYDESKFDEYNQYMKDAGIWTTLYNSLSFTNVPLTDENFAIAAYGHMVKNASETNVPGLIDFQKKAVPEMLKRGYVELPNGWRLSVSEKPQVMAALLQGFERVMMVRTGICLKHRLTKEKIPHTFRLMVHDEYQIQTTRRHAQYVRVAFQEELEKARLVYGTHCPLGVDVSEKECISLSWAGTH